MQVVCTSLERGSLAYMWKFSLWIYALALHVWIILVLTNFAKLYSRRRLCIVSDEVAYYVSLMFMQDPWEILQPLVLNCTVVKYDTYNAHIEHYRAH